jgi:hypothetical protein
MKSRSYIFLALAIIATSLSFSCKSGSGGKSSKSRKQDTVVVVTSNYLGAGKAIEIEMLKGKSHNYPTFAIWLEDTSGKYIQSLFVTRAIGQSVFEYGDNSGGSWKSGEVRRPAALPYWANKRGIVAADGLLIPSPQTKVPDAYTGATPKGSFNLKTKTDNMTGGKVKVMMEINQTWDWNQFWTNTKYPEDAEYKTSCQPAVVYEALVDFGSPGSKVQMKPVGHSHYSGKTGELYTDVSTLTTALHIAEKITVTVK